MTIDNKIKDEIKNTIKISLLSSGKIDKYEHFTGE